eukprot:6184648-Pleurochrysis_carterae.AAC.3
MSFFPGVLLLAGTLTNAFAFPLLSDFFSNSDASNDIGLGGLAAGVGCPEHRPLPPIDPIEGLSWLNHVKNLPTPCFEKMNLGWEDIEDADAHRITQLILAGVKSLTLYQNHLGERIGLAVCELSACIGLKQASQIQPVRVSQATRGPHRLRTHSRIAPSPNLTWR